MMRFPLHKQYDSMQCGLACLQMICDFFGTNYSLETISRYCFATTEGTSLRSINEAALKLGFHTIVGKVTIPQLKEASLMLRNDVPSVVAKQYRDIVSNE